MDRSIIKRAKEWRMSSDDVLKKIELDKKRIESTEKLFKDFLPWISQYRSTLYVGYEFAETYSTFVSIIFRDIELVTTNSPFGANLHHLHHLRIGMDFDGNYTYYLEYSLSSEPDAGIQDTKSIRMGSFKELIKGLAEEFGKLGIYTEDEETVRDIIT